MSPRDSVLCSSYVIDGVMQDPNPAGILAAVCDDVPTCTFSPGPGIAEGPVIVDETVDAPVSDADIASLDPMQCLDALRLAVPAFPYSSPDSATRFLLCSALASSLWREGRFRLGNLRLAAHWHWNEAPVGAMAAFYRSVAAAADCIDSLGLRFSSCDYQRGADSAELSFTLGLAGFTPDPDDSDDVRLPGSYHAVLEPFCLADPQMGDGRLCPAALVPDPSSWVICVPLDQCGFRLGGSLLSSALSLSGSDPHIEDSDYFLDCYEVLREFAEDGVLLSASEVGRGGLAACLRTLCSGGTGLRADLSGLMSAYDETSAVRVLFSEIPAVVIQIRDSDFDYVDAELLLQDVAYFPLGHPDPGGALSFGYSRKGAIQTILESLLQNAGRETE